MTGISLTRVLWTFLGIAGSACTGSLGVAAIASGLDPDRNGVPLFAAGGLLLLLALALASASVRAFVRR